MFILNFSEICTQLVAWARGQGSIHARTEGPASASVDGARLVRGALIDESCDDSPAFVSTRRGEKGFADVVDDIELALLKDDLCQGRLTASYVRSSADAADFLFVLLDADDIVAIAAGRNTAGQAGETECSSALETARSCALYLPAVCAAQGRGFGRALLTELKDRFAELVVEALTPAAGFYHKLGFRYRRSCGEAAIDAGAEAWDDLRAERSSPVVLALMRALADAQLCGREIEEPGPEGDVLRMISCFKRGATMRWCAR